MPTGVADLLVVAAIGYVVLALGLAALAFWIPNNLVLRIACASLVLFAFARVPYRHYQEAEDRSAKFDELRSRITLSCANQSISPLTSRPNSLHIASSAITGIVSVGDAIRYMLERQLDRLEIDTGRLTDADIDRLSVYAGVAGPNDLDVNKVLALSVLRHGDPRCSTLERSAREHSALTLRAWRKIGLGPENCIGADLLERPTTTLSLSASSRLLLPGMRVAEYKYSLRDGSAEPVATATATLGNDPNGKKYVCLSDSDQKRDPRANSVTIDRIVPSLTPIGAPTEIDDDPPEFPVQREATSADILQSRQLVGVGRIWSTNNVNGDATIWIDSTSSRGEARGYYLTFFGKPSLKQVLIRHAGIRIQEVTGLSVTTEEIRLVGLDVGRKNGRILVYSTTGIPRAALSLTDAQYKELIEGPAK